MAARRKKRPDSYAVREIDLWIDNNEPLYRGKEDVKVKLTELVCRGVGAAIGKFSKAKAARRFMPLVNAAVASYRREIEDAPKFTPAVKRAAAQTLVAEYMSNVRNYRRHKVRDLPPAAIRILDSGRCAAPTASSGLMGLGLCAKSSRACRAKVNRLFAAARRRKR